MTPYTDDREHLRDHLRLLDLRCRRHLERWWAEFGGGSDEFGGLYVSDEEVARLLYPSPEPPTESRDRPAGTRDRPTGTSDRPTDPVAETGDSPGGADHSPGGADHSSGGADHSPGGAGRESPGAGWPDDGGSDPMAELPGGLGPDDDVDWTPAGEWHPDDEPGAWGGFEFPDDDELSARIESVSHRIRRREAATRAAGRELRLVALADRFGLDDRHRDALLVALAPELDRKYEKVYGYLQDDITRTKPSVDLVLRIRFPDESARLAARSLFVGSSPLVRHRLLRRGGDESAAVLSRPVSVDDRVVDYLLGGDDVDDALADVATVVEPDADSAPSDRDLPRAVEERLDHLSDRLVDSADRLPDSADRRPPMAAFTGPYGVGKATAVEAVCADAGTPILRVRAAGIDPAHLGETLAHLGRELRLRDAVCHLDGLDDLVEEPPAEEERRPRDALDAEQVVALLDDLPGPVFVSATEAVSPRVQARLDDHEFVSVSFPIPSFDRRRARWRAVDGLPDDADPADLASKFRLTPGQIEDAVSTARTLTDGSGLTADAVYAGCRAQSRKRLGSLAQRIEPSYDWDDIVLPAVCERALREVAVHVRHRGTVFSEWGFEEKYSLGNGLCVLFAGPSGTGKTMAAEIIAADAGLDLYRLDLSSVVSKYIGETEKNLRAVFDEAEASNAVLFFDEADAIFGERSEVRDSHDRYANVEVSYLLQRIEAHDGTVILASNLKENIDDAFTRRINLTVDFPLPDRESREAIWHAVFPADAPLGDLDLAFCSTFELAGGSIKNAALTASFLAAEDGDRIEMRHLVRAVERELQKSGRLVTPSAFGEYEDLLGE